MAITVPGPNEKTTSSLARVASTKHKGGKVRPDLPPKMVGFDGRFNGI